MAWKVLKDGVTLKELTKERPSRRDPEKLARLYKSEVYLAGDVISDDKLANVHKESYKANEGSIREQIEEIPEVEENLEVKVKETKKVKVVKDATDEEEGETKSVRKRK